MKNYLIFFSTALGAFFILYLLNRNRKAPQYFTMDAIQSRGTPPPPELQKNASELLDNINLIQDEFFKLNPNYKLKLHSTFRTPTHNQDVGGAKKSYHMQARAVDFSVQDLPAREVQRHLYKLMRAGIIPKGGIGQGGTYAHFDNKGTISTWKYGAGNVSYSVNLSTLE